MTLKPFVASLAVVGMSTMFVAGAAAQDSRESLVVSADWVAEHLNDDNLVLLHVGEDTAYQSEHIPGAYFVSFMEIWHEDSHGGGDNLVLELPEPARFQTILRGWGINDDSRIVVYWGSEWVTPTARTIFTLDWAGLGDRTVLMNGGIGAWKAAGYDVTAEGPRRGTGNVTVRPRDDLIVDAMWVQAHAKQPGYALVDARSQAVFDGIQETRGRAGHIPGAGATPWGEFVDEEIMLRSAAELEAVFAGAGVRDGDMVVAYCHIGQYATLALFAARTMGYEVKLYDGSFQDWAQRDLPVER